MERSPRSSSSESYSSSSESKGSGSSNEKKSSSKTTKSLGEAMVKAEVQRNEPKIDREPIFKFGNESDKTTSETINKPAPPDSKEAAREAIDDHISERQEAVAAELDAVNPDSPAAVEAASDAALLEHAREQLADSTPDSEIEPVFDAAYAQTAGEVEAVINHSGDTENEPAANGQAGSDQGRETTPVPAAGGSGEGDPPSGPTPGPEAGFPDEPDEPGSAHEHTTPEASGHGPADTGTAEAPAAGAETSPDGPPETDPEPPASGGYGGSIGGGSTGHAEFSPSSDENADDAYARGKRKGLVTGGILGYLYGRHKGIRKTEKHLNPVIKGLEGQVKQADKALAERERDIRSLAAKKLEQAPRPVAYAVAAERLVVPRQQQRTPSAPNQEKIPLQRQPAQERVNGPSLIQTAAEAAAIASVTSERVPRQPEQASAAEVLPLHKTVEELTGHELKAIAEKVIIDHVSLKEMYESRQFDEKGLRRIVAEFLGGGDVKKALTREVIRKQKTFELDPGMRSQNGDSVQGGAGAAVQTAQQPVLTDNNTSLQTGTFDAGNHPLAEKQRQLSQQKKRQTTAAAGATVLVVIAIIIIFAVASR